MKKLFIFAALAFGLASCESTNENIFGFEVNNEKPVEFTIKVTAPEAEETRVASSAYSDSALGGLANGVIPTIDDTDNVTLRYILDVYDAKEVRSEERYIKYSDNESVNFEPRLIPDRKYTFVVWVDIVKKDNNGNWVNAYYNTKNLRNVRINYDEWQPMDESRDAFTGFTVVESLTKQGDIEVKCTRPFAKLRIITTDEVAVADLHVSPDYAVVEYKKVPVYTFDAFNGEYKQSTTDSEKTMSKSHSLFEIVNYASNNDTDKKEFCLLTDYFFAPLNATVLGNFTLKVYDTNNIETIITSTNFPTDIPLQRNTLTTISGNLLTIDNGFTVKATVMENFGVDSDNDSTNNPAGNYDKKYEQDGDGNWIETSNTPAEGDQTGNN